MLGSVHSSGWSKGCVKRCQSTWLSRWYLSSLFIQAKREPHEWSMITRYTCSRRLHANVSLRMCGLVLDAGRYNLNTAAYAARFVSFSLAKHKKLSAKRFWMKALVRMKWNVSFMISENLTSWLKMLDAFPWKQVHSFVELVFFWFVMKFFCLFLCFYEIFIAFFLCFAYTMY